MWDKNGREIKKKAGTRQIKMRLFESEHGKMAGREEEEVWSERVDRREGTYVPYPANTEHDVVYKGNERIWS